MLSFIREQGNNMDLPMQKQGAAARGASGDGTGKSQEMEYLTVAAHKKRAHKSTTLLAVLFIIGLLCLWFMIKKSTPRTASAANFRTEETKIEAAIARLTGVKSEMFSGMDEIVSKFYEFSDVLQVHVNELVKNPFELEMFLDSLRKKTDTEKKAPEIDTEIVWRQQIRQKGNEMQLLSIMQSDQGNCCMIDNKILYVGDLIGDFKIRRIGDSFVELESDGVEIVLKLSE